MAKVKITGHASGTGILTVTAPNTSTDRTITLPDATGTLATTADAFNPDAAVTINDTGADVDFRVESNGDANMLFVDGGNDRVGIGTNLPSTHLHVKGNTVNTVTLECSLTNGSSPGLDFADLYSSGAIRGRIATMVPGDGATGEMRFYTRQSSTLTEILKLCTDGRGDSQFTAKAWISIDGTGTVGIRDSHNFSSVTDNGTGLYNPNFTVALANDSYSAVATVGESSNGGAAIETPTTSTMRVTSANAAGTAADYGKVNVIVFGD